MFNPIEEVAAALSRGELVVLTDDENRENEGDLICSARFATPENVNFILRHGRGVFCVPVAAEVARRLSLAVPPGRHDPRGTAFSQSLDAISGTTTGVSAYDRAATVAAILDPAAGIDDFYSPGHVYPLLARAGGVLERRGHTEGVIDLMKIAGLPPVGVLCEILNEDGTMARLPDLEAFCAKYNLKLCSVDAIANYRKNRNI